MTETDDVDGFPNVVDRVDYQVVAEDQSAYLLAAMGVFFRQSESTRESFKGLDSVVHPVDPTLRDLDRAQLLRDMATILADLLRGDFLAEVRDGPRRRNCRMAAG